jgi:hypothetical protein
VLSPYAAGSHRREEPHCFLLHVMSFHRARAGAWALRSGRLACWDMSHHALGHCPGAGLGSALLCTSEPTRFGHRLLNCFLFSEYIFKSLQFENLCRIHLNSENYETNFVG